MLIPNNPDLTRDARGIARPEQLTNTLIEIKYIRGKKYL